MNNFVLIAICMGAGILLRLAGMLPKDAYKSVNTWILYVALPAFALKFIPGIQWTAELLLPGLMPLLVWCGAWLTVELLALIAPMDKATRAALILTAGLGNTSFVGFPLTEAYYGAEGLQIAIICDQATFVVLATAGITTAMNASARGNFSIKMVLWKLFRFPPFLAFITALILPRWVSFSGISSLLDVLAGTLIPLALFSVGMQLRVTDFKSDAYALSIGLIYKLLAAPAIVLLMAIFLDFRGIAAQVSIFEAAMAPMVTASIIAVEYDLNPKLATLMVGLGIPLSFISTFAWWILLNILY